MTIRYFTTILLMLLLPALSAQERGPGIIPGKAYLWFGGTTSPEDKDLASPVTQAPPFCGKKRRQAGNVLSLPFGAGIHAISYQQSYTASELLLFKDDSDITARADSIYQNTTSGETKVTFRPDVWIFPFLNVYGIFGYTQGITNPDLLVPYIVVNVPSLGDIRVDVPFEISDQLRYYGPTYGGGATASGGFRSYFLLIDYHYTVTDPNDLDGKLYNHFLSAKAAVLLGGKRKKSSGAFWVGTMYISDHHTFQGDLEVSDIAPELVPIIGEKAKYSGKVTSIHPWNLIFGGAWYLRDRHHLVLEAGLFERKQLSFSYNFRF